MTFHTPNFGFIVHKTHFSQALLADIAMLSHRGQTSALEAFHATLNHYAPKVSLSIECWNSVRTEIIYKSKQYFSMTF